MPKIPRIAVSAVLTVTLAGAAWPARAGELRVGVARLPVSLEPTAATTPTDAMLARLLFEGLVTIDDRGEIAPALAASWMVSRDGLTWTFRLREEVRLSTGAVLSAEDLVAALAPRIGPEEAAEPAPAWTRPFRGPARVVQEIRRGDAPGTIQVQLSQPYAALLAVLAYPALAVAGPAADGAIGPPGTGPYRVAEAAAGRLVLEAVPAPGRAAPRSERIVVVEVADEGTALAGLAPGGPLDVWLTGAAPVTLPPGLQVLSGPSWSIGLLALRSDQGLFRQKVARQAAALALDPAALQVALGRGARLLFQYLPPGAWAAREVPRPFDPGRAKKLLAQLGTADLGLTLVVPDLGGGLDGARVADALRAALAAVGFRPRVRVEPVDAAAALLRRGEADLGLLETRLEVDDPHFFLRPLLASDAATPGSATNVAFLRSPLVDGMLGRASQLGFRPERLRLYQRLQAHVAEEGPYQPFYARVQWLLARPEVRDLALQSSGLHRLERFWVEPPAAPAPPPSASAPGAPPPPAPQAPGPAPAPSPAATP